ncbi:MAG: bifunctional phosphoribosyl-AMP cyclohydrolase/phosphoribosyl-ATP diphosphatase HisIE [Succinivibrionaceae bacterium]|nr:bifunctional phosphoribosyl-AMP cyclohydrolase/phosphoribosyl-ATP diphosphatase HisIE [Succinivibrionaceae bacterium]
MMPVIVQNHRSGKVLMFAYMNRQALDKTLETGLATFFSRTKQRLWTKGEESKHYLHVVALTTDCDSDTLLLSADPEGPTCHNGTESCFDTQPELALGFLAELEALVESRKEADPEKSYTAKLFHNGVPRIAKKVGEEAIETALAAVSEDKEEFIGEAADLLFHLTVLLSAKKVKYSDVMTCLSRRHSNFNQYKVEHAIKKSKTC